MTVKFSFDKQALQNIGRFFEQNNQVRIGVLSKEWKVNPNKKHERKIGPVELAAVHEFGSTKRRIPQRSFLRKTMVNRRKDYVKEIEGNRDSIMKMIARGDYIKFLSRVGAVWRAYVLDTFDLQGPGWQALATSTMARRKAKWGHEERNGKLVKVKKKSSRILWVTGALARSVGWEIRGQ